MTKHHEERIQANVYRGSTSAKVRWARAALKWGSTTTVGLLAALMCVACEAETRPEVPADEDIQIIGRIVSTSLLGSQETLEGSVLVTHPDSLDQLVGGVVRQGDNLLGVLVQVSAGTFTYAIPFREISSINEGEAGSVTLSVVVLDNEGGMARDEFELELCASQMLSCSGQCVDPQGPNAC